MFWKDQFAIYPGALAASLSHRESTTQQIYLNNPVSPDADFTVTVSNNLAGSQVVYDYKDSLTGGVTYNWTEISTTGTLLADISETDNAAQEVVLNNFTVPFYGTHYDRVYVASNGLLTFGSPSTDSGNDIIPYEYEPNNFIALFWDDLDTNDAIADDGGEVYFQEFADRLIVQYEAVMRDSDSDPTTESNTFQVVLHASGLIEVFYKQMGGDLRSATIGIEDSSGTNGIEVLYNGYRTIHPTFTLSDGLALSYMPEPAKFVQVSPLTGTTTTGNTSVLEFSFNSFDLAPGRYTANIDLAHTGTGTTPWTIPAVLEVTNPPTQIAITSPQDGTVFWSDQSLRIYVSASDDDFGIERVEFFYDETKFHEDLSPSYYYYWPNPSIGTYALTARAVDPFGTVTISDPVTITVLEDSDGDRLEDPWEILYFGDLSQDDLGDFDGDGAANRLEYDRGTDPTDPNETPVNQPSIIVITEPVAAYTVFQGNNIYLEADVSDPDSELDRVDFYYGDSFIGSDTSVNYGSAARSWYNAPHGTHSLTARAVDIYGAVTISDPVTITVLQDSDSDRMEDDWERTHFGDLAQNPLGDYDGDGLDNLSEYDLGTDPSSVDTDGDGLSDAIESSILASNDPNNYYYLDPTNADTDGDGINDGDDSADGDTLSNLEELALGTDLNLADTDADGVFDDVEVEIGTDPTISNDFANMDSDGDGLSDLFELNFGTDPNDPDTNDNGMNDGEELDNGGDPINPGPPPPPLTPGPPPGVDPNPTPPDPIVPGGYDILIEAVKVSQPKHGFAPYQEINPTKRYLTQSSSQSFSGGCPESGPRNVSGSKTTTIDPLTGASETTGDTFVNSGGAAESSTRKSGTRQISSYDDPPNEETDCTGTIRYNSHLSSEYTTSALILNGMSELLDYEEEFVRGTPYAYRNLHENELRFDYQKVKFKFKWHDGVDEEAKFTIEFLVIFIPEDDPETEEVDESEQVEFVKTIRWDGHGAESPVFEINPDSLKSGADGRYQLLKVDLGYLVDEQEPAVGAEYNLFDGPQRYLKGRRINFELDGAEDIPSAQIDWDGTFGVTSIGGGHRTWKVYLDPASSSETDYKTVIAEIASSIVAEEEILVCKYVLGIHSNAGPDSGFTAGHAWITVADWTNGTNPTVTRLGLWPDEHQRTIDNGDESDVRENLEKSVLGAYNRFYLLSPSEFQNLINFRNQHAEWTYFNTCANWAMDAVQAAVGEEVDASDTVFFGTPRKISESIISLEAEEPTTGLEPRDSGADIEEGSSTGNSTWTGTSFSN